MWDNYEELEEKLSLDELMATLDAAREREHRQNKFMAALKGIDIDEGSKEESMKRVVEEMQRLEAEEGLEPTPPRNNMNGFSEFGIAVVEGE